CLQPLGDRGVGANRAALSAVTIVYYCFESRRGKASSVREIHTMARARADPRRAMNQSKEAQMLKAMMTVVASVALAACASMRVAPERIQASEQAIQAAQATGAERQPDAAKYLELAQSELTQGKKLSDAGEREKA